MLTARFYLPPAEWSEPELVLTGEEARHCVQVTRHREGDQIAVFDGRGRLATGTITATSKEQVNIQVTRTENHSAPVRPVTLVQGIVKGDTMDWVIEKAVELGVQQIVPWLAQRSIVRLNPADAARKREKWQRVALEACKQCGQTWLPRVEIPCTLEQVDDHVASHQLKLVSSLHASARPLRKILAAEAPVPAGGLVIAIGPEGDFTPEEHQALVASDWQPWSLGALTLRSETAAICALSILSYELHSL